jgi:stage V sporulation protein R
MSIDDLIDAHSVAIKRREEVSRYDFSPEKEDDDTKPTRFKSKGYMDEYINPKAALKAEEEERKKLKEAAAKNFPEHPEKDVLLFLIEHAPLKGWQRDILSIVRDEAYYFAPQGMTKIMNEGWACVVAGTRVGTDRGLLRIEEIVADREPLLVGDGETLQRIYDWAKFSDRPTVRIRTRRGLELEGSVTHQVLMQDGSWRRLDALAKGDVVAISRGGNSWPQSLVKLDWQPRRRVTLQEVAQRAGVDIETVIRYREGVRGRHSATLAPLVAEYDTGLAALPHTQKRRLAVRFPTHLDERLAAFLGYLIGDGHVSAVKRVLGLTTGDEEQASRFADLTEVLFGVVPRRKKDQGRWRVGCCSQDLKDFLVHLGLQTGVCARTKGVPEAILRSPKPVVASFLRAYFDCDGYAGRQGVILSTASESLGRTVQLLLLHFGILSRRRPHKDGCWHVHVTGRSAEAFAREIGFGLLRKQAALETYLSLRQWFKEEQWTDEIVDITHSRADVFDISVEETHRYAAQGFINHNSYWHSTIMTTKALHPSEVVDYCDHHCGTMAPYRARINPYKLGIELFRDIEHRWDTGRFGKEYDDCDDLEKKRTWDRKLGLGREKIFEVRRIHNDITFIDTFLTPEFCQEQKYFSYLFNEQGHNYVIESREFQKIKQRLLFGLTNFGKPWIYVVDGNYRNRGELLLRHEYNGLDLKLDRATDVLANVQRIWSRPVHLQTVVDNKPTLLSFDGTEHSSKTLGEPDDPRRNAAAKTK